MFFQVLLFLNLLSCTYKITQIERIKSLRQFSLFSFLQNPPLSEEFSLIFFDCDNKSGSCNFARYKNSMLSKKKIFNHVTYTS